MDQLLEELVRWSSPALGHFIGRFRPSVDADLGLGWRTALRRAAAPGRPSQIERSTTCVLCGRSRPPSLPVRCLDCGGAWLST